MKNLLDIWRPNQSNPWREFSLLQRQMDRLFDDVTRYEPMTEMQGNVDFVPACDFEENDNNYLVNIDVPGMTKDQLNVELSGNTLTISGEKKEEKKEGKGKQRSYERFQGRFERSFTLPDITEGSKVEANYKDGVLRVAVTKAEAAKAKTRKIQINEGKGPLLEKPIHTEQKSVKTAEKAA